MAGQAPPADEAAGGAPPGTSSDPDFRTSDAVCAQGEHPPRQRASGCHLISGHTNRVPVSTNEDASATTSSAFVSCVVMPNAFTTLQRPPL